MAAKMQKLHVFAYRTLRVATKRDVIRGGRKFGVFSLAFLAVYSACGLQPVGSLNLVSSKNRGLRSPSPHCLSASYRVCSVSDRCRPLLLCGAFFMDPLRLRGGLQMEQEAQGEALDSEHLPDAAVARERLVGGECQGAEAPKECVPRVQSRQSLSMSSTSAVRGAEDGASCLPTPHNRPCGAHGDSCDHAMDTETPATPWMREDPTRVPRRPAQTCLQVAAFDSSKTSQKYDAQGNFSTRYTWDPLQRTWLLLKHPHEDWSVESLRDKWDFPACDCLIFRHRKPDKWQYVDWAPGVLGWVECLLFFTPVLNQLLYFWRGLFPCAVCGKARDMHPLPSDREADAAFWQAVTFRDVELAVRLIRGGVECDPGGANWCLLAYLQSNYCKDAFSQFKHLDQEKAHEHLWNPPPRATGLTGYDTPFI